MGMNMKPTRAILHSAAATTYKSGHSGMHRMFLVSHVTVLVAVFRVIRGGLQRLPLIRGEESEDLLVVSLVLLLRLGAPGRLRVGEMRDFCLLVIRQLH